MNGAKGVIINITGSPDIGLEEVEEASNIIAQAAHADANIIWGAALDDSMNDEIRVTVIATGAAGIKKGDTNTVIPGYEADNQQSGENSDDDYIDIMTIFNKNK